MSDALSIEDREARVAEIDNRLAEIDADYAGQLMPDSVREEWNGLNAERDEQATTVGELRARRDRLGQLQATPAATERAVTAAVGAPAVLRSRGTEIYDIARIRAESRNDGEYVERLRDNAKRAIERARYGPVRDRISVEDAQSNVMRLLDGIDDERGTLARRILATGSPEYERWFWDSIRAGYQLPRPQAALSMGSATSAQVAVPFTLDPTVILTSDGATNPIRAIARVETITGRAWEGVTSAGITVGRSGEATEVDDDAPAMAQPTVTPTRVDGFVPFSVEADQDWSQLRSEMTRLLTDAKDVEEATSFLVGDGNAPNPAGICSTLTTASNVNDGYASFEAADIYAVENALPPRFQPRARWLARKNTYNLVRALDTNGTLYARLTEGRPPELIGYPAHEASAMRLRNTAGNRYLILGDFQQFLIVDKAGMDIELVPHLFHTNNNRPSGQRGLVAFWRNNAAILVPNAFRGLTYAT
jgi:HK97 family phage major capsid protein